MPKGFFSQGMCLLTDGRPTIADVKSAVEAAGFHIVREIAPQEQWTLGGPAVLIPYRPEVNGTVTIDVVNRPWPDGMGDPKSDPMTFVAWSMGYFGPFAFPGSLQRAIQHAWSWPAAKEIAPTHRAFIRLRASYVSDERPDPNAPVLPQDYAPVAEMMFLSRLVIALGAVPGVLCYFNVNGEVLRTLDSFRADFEGAREQEKIPLLLWMNARLFDVDGTIGLIDTVGNSQLDVRDIEAAYPTARYDANTIDYYTRNVTHYLLDLGREIETGEPIDGPNETALSWTSESCGQPLATPPRRTLRLYPKADAAAIRKALKAAAENGK
jgi:hypothetical protein